MHHQYCINRHWKRWAIVSDMKMHIENSVTYRTVDPQSLMVKVMRLDTRVSRINRECSIDPAGL